MEEHQCRSRANRFNILILLKFTAWAETGWEKLGGDFRLPQPTAGARLLVESR